MKFIISALLCLLVRFTFSQTQVTYVFVGSYTDNKPGNGIYIYKLDPLTGNLEELSHGENLTNPSFLTISKDGQFLYACTDTRSAEEGSITSFSINRNTGTISLINKQHSGGANPAYLSVDPESRFIVNANYTGGTLSVLPIANKGSIGLVAQNFIFHDSSIIKERQQSSHVHSAVYAPDNKFVFAPDLGADKIRAFSFNANSSRPLRELDALTVRTDPGSGPRHIIFHPNQKFAYCTEEMSGMVSVYSYGSGRLSRIQRILSYASDTATFATADLRISPDGNFVYVSNRLENTISAFSVANDGRLKFQGRQSTLGDIPRNFAIDPSGRFLIVANQSSNNIFVFERDKKTGLLKKVGKEIAVSSPSCVQIRSYTVSK